MRDSIPTGGTFRCMFTTNGSDGSAISFSDALEAGDIRIYKDGGTAERSSTAGYTITTDFDGVVALHLFSADLSNNTDAGFYSQGHVYDVVLVPDTETIDSVAPAPAIIGRFRVVAAETVAGVPETRAAAIADGSIAAATFDTDLDFYAAKVWVQDKNSATPTDRYTVIWTKNSADLTAGITSPTIQVIKRSDGSDLVASTAMTQVAATGIYKKDETTNLMVPGESYIIKVTATIDSSTRTSYWVQGRDVAA